MKQFVDACVNDKEVPVGIHAGLQAVKVALAAKESVANSTVKFNNHKKISSPSFRRTFFILL